MRDLHSHYLPGVDDGSKSIDATKKMLENAALNGITDIIFTPHYILDSRFMSSKSTNEKIIEPIILFAKEEYNINVFLGNEVYCNTEIWNLYKKGEITTLNGSRYMLIEIPMYSKINNVKSIFLSLFQMELFQYLLIQKDIRLIIMILTFFRLKEYGSSYANECFKYCRRLW